MFQPFLSNLHPHIHGEMAQNSLYPQVLTWFAHLLQQLQPIEWPLQHLEIHI